MKAALDGAFSRKGLAMRAQGTRNHAISMAGLLADAEESARCSELEIDRQAAAAAATIIQRHIARLNETAEEWESASKGLSP